MSVTSDRVRKGVLVAALLVFAGASALLAARTFNSISPPGENTGDLADFRDAVYFPAKAVLNGDNPYDTPAYLANYPEVAQDFPLYTPSHLTFFMVFQATSLEVARAVHFVITLGLLVYLARLSLTAVLRQSWALTFFLAAFLVVCLPGRFVLGTGQTTVLTAVALLNAWLWRDRPWVSAAWLVIVMFKPVVGIPIAAVFIAARFVKPAVLGFAGTVLLSLPVLVACIVSAGGIGGFADSVRRNLDYFANNPQVQPESRVRLDLTSVVARVLERDVPEAASVVLSVLVFGAVLYVVHRTVGVAQGLDTLALGITGVLLVGYQPVYHGIFLVPILVWVAFDASRVLRHRWVLTGLLTWVIVNPFATVAFNERVEGGRLGLLGAPLCGACIAVACAIIAVDLLSAARAAGIEGARLAVQAADDPAGVEARP